MINLSDAIAKNKSSTFLITDSAQYSYAYLHAKILSLEAQLKKNPVKSIWLLESENSFDCFVKILALLDVGQPFLLLPRYLFIDLKYREFLFEELKSDLVFCPVNADLPEQSLNEESPIFHEKIKTALSLKKSTFIVRTSGSSGGKHKFILHDADLFKNKYLKIGSHFESTFAFSPIESIAGIETLLECITHGKTLVATLAAYSPAKISQMLSLYEVDYFQTTPSFINLMLFAGELKANKLPKLKKIAYGSEPSYKNTTQVLKKELPHVELMHTYGMSEIGILKTVTDQFRADEFLLNLDFNEGRIVNGYLEVTTLTPMLGYLNYLNAQPDRWYKTGDLAEIDTHSGFYKVLGRSGDIINVAGQKFFPVELEKLVLEMAEVKDVVIVKEKHPLVGEAIVMKVNLQSGVDSSVFQANFKRFCESKLPRFMHPHRVLILEEALSNDRFKKVRVE